jgi:hypothetical protein
MGKLYNWYEYLVDLKSKCDWLSVLKIALDIYHGEIKGYSGVPIEKDE